MLIPNIKQITFIVFCGILILFSPVAVQAHFIWVARSVENEKINIYFGEQPEPDNAAFLDGIVHMQVMSVDADGGFSELAFEKKVQDGDGWFECDDSQPLDAVDVSCLYGVFERGDDAMLLIYAAKYLKHAGKPVAPSGQLVLDVFPAGDKDDGTFRAQFRGAAASGCEVLAIDEEGNEQTLTTDDDGHFQIDGFDTGRWLIRVKNTETDSGEHEGKKYDNKVYYCTLTLDRVKAAVPDSGTTIR